MIRFIALGGFLGAGKTTTMIAAARLLEARGRRVAVITNDQGTELIDTRLARARLAPMAGGPVDGTAGGGAAVGEVTGGCFCCRFDDLMDVAAGLLDAGTADTVLAEAVGSCTDLQATVIRPLGAYYGTRFAPAPLTVVVDPDRYRALGSALPLHDREDDLAYLFGHQLEEADIIAVNKADLMPGAERERLVDGLSRRYPDATVLAYSARRGDALEDLVDAWEAPSRPGRTVDIDYDRYAAAEAGLAWFNRTYTVTGRPDYSPERWARAALAHLSRAAERAGWAVGHVKISVDTAAGLTKAGFVTGGAAPVVDLAPDALVARTGRAILNARIACEPAAMDAAATDAVAAADGLTGAVSTPAPAPAPAGGDGDPGIAFKPGYPRPVHRLTGSAPS
ncbi:GTP-binding protein [Actinomadura sp. 9N407]|uniref:GTP-binding protein n=1 Tax=Actinomadura sp. 9N407 TaxID=3375154 RepID=UPI0037949D15